MSILSQSIDSLSFDNSFSSFSESQPQTSLSQINIILSSLEEIEQFVNVNTHKEREIKSISRILTTIISKCTEIQNALQSRSRHSTIKFTPDTNDTDDDETFQHFEQALTPKFNFKKEFDLDESKLKVISLCDGPSLSSCDCSSLNSSTMVENINVKTLLRTVKEIQDKGIITKKQKKFLKEKIISKDMELYSFISKNEGNSNIEVTRALRTYLKQFKII